MPFSVTMPLWSDSLKRSLYAGAAAALPRRDRGQFAADSCLLCYSPPAGWIWMA